MKKYGIVLNPVVVFAMMAVVVDWVYGVGSLTPAAAPAPLFKKTLDEVEPRTIIDSIPVTISDPGFYYLIGDLTNTVNNADGIIIDTDEVDLDMRGFTLYGEEDLRGEQQ